MLGSNGYDIVTPDKDGDTDADKQIFVHVVGDQPLVASDFIF